jgi:hypothetical protein
LRSRLSRSTVLAPIEPVAPRMVTVRSAGARLNVARKISDFIKSPYQQAVARGLEATARQSDQRSGGAGAHEAVETIH